MLSTLKNLGSDPLEGLVEGWQLPIASGFGTPRYAEEARQPSSSLKGV
jgi:hypothetical protein